MVDRLDAYQRRHGWLGLPIAVGYKTFDDRGPYLAALITYYGFVSLFPLLLLFFSVVGFVLHGDQALQQRLAHSALRDFPIVGPQLQHNIGAFRGSGAALGIGIVGSLYGGLGIMQAAQAAFNRIYTVPRNEQPNPLSSRLRSLGLLGLLGGGVIVTTALSVGSADVSSLFGTRISLWLSLGGILVTYLLNVALFTGAFQLLTGRELRFRNVVHGGLIAAAAWQLLQTEGTRYLTHELSHANQVYGSFALVLGLVAWIYLGALVVIISAEINRVVNERLWPRALLTPFTDAAELTDVDRRLYTAYAQSERYKGFEKIAVAFEPDADAPGTREPPAAVENTTLLLPADLQLALREQARRRGRSRAELVRKALRSYLEGAASPGPRSLGLGSDAEPSGRESET
jgi:YihY family inner membrane protein